MEFETNQSNKKENVINIILLVLIVLSINALFWGLKYHALFLSSVFWHSLWFSIPSFLIFSFFIITYLREDPKAADTIGGILFFGFIFFLLIGFGAVSIVNAVGDTTPGKEYVVPVINYNIQSYSSAGGNPSIEVNTHLTDLGINTLSIEATVDQYRKVKDNDRCTLMIKPGFLGHQWLQSCHCS